MRFEQVFGEQRHKLLQKAMHKRGLSLMNAKHKALSGRVHVWRAVILRE